MRHVWLAAILAASAPAAAAPTCTYSTAYSSPYIEGPCFVDAVEGCPIHLLLPHDEVPDPLNPIVVRDGDVVALASTTAVVGSQPETLGNTDYLSCDCAHENVTIQFDQLALTLTGAREGDVVSLGGGEIAIGPAGACAAPDWPTDFEVQLGGCDLCPMDPPTQDPPHDGGSPAAGCSTGAPPGMLLVALVLVRRRGRR